MWPWCPTVHLPICPFSAAYRGPCCLWEIPRSDETYNSFTVFWSAWGLLLVGVVHRILPTGQHPGGILIRLLIHIDFLLSIWRSSSLPNLQMPQEWKSSHVLEPKQKWTATGSLHFRKTLQFALTKAQISRGVVNRTTCRTTKGIWVALTSCNKANFRKSCSCCLSYDVICHYCQSELPNMFKKIFMRMTGIVWILGLKSRIFTQHTLLIFLIFFFQLTQCETRPA